MAKYFTEEQIENFRTAFRVFDTDHSNTICVKELRHVLESADQHPTDEELQEMMDFLDTDGNGVLDFDEFVVMMAMAEGHCEEELKLKAAFKAFDKDGNGFISREELKSVLEAEGEKLSAADIDEMIKEADTNGDGQIDYSEFVVMMAQH
ncbi:putative EF-hand domain containing protein [Monocercomonoides exilis]|uniref:putative EF-hand domain containing protein n=1 Tax=Monocercomonoides exilis TaxID=2049356 RepID=UPI00355952C2|nr:putative EF-hand domain containing protein [Monocercomonoides exilis]|eukprot:MONOS_6287.1-p1 / transcript=MONOS_6287.1 / gene=MONOS_6287 / organism=Monocercomonoides_exilis_PA203 / gene_product=EF-hand domain containing protein / transcript_product=EF-hand domain containing protein / location=Mono_scaffold00196:13101-13757(-) / protein_length=149 / sequence_SO=supercontig / SO=protein_coding / is_pseudo=false